MWPIRKIFGLKSSNTFVQLHMYKYFLKLNIYRTFFELTSRSVRSFFFSLAKMIKLKITVKNFNFLFWRKMFDELFCFIKICLNCWYFKWTWFKFTALNMLVSSPALIRFGAINRYSKAYCKFIQCFTIFAGGWWWKWVKAIYRLNTFHSKYLFNPGQICCFCIQF